MFDIGKRTTGTTRREDAERTPEYETAATSAPQAAPSQMPATPAPATSSARRSEAAVIGPSIHIDGNLRGEEDLIIEGEVSGTVELKTNSLTIGRHGKVKADVYAHTLRVEGSVEGNLYASEVVAIRNSAQVKGNVVAPRVNLEDGAKFKGSIEMDSQAVEAAIGTSRSSSSATSSSSGSGKKSSSDDASRQSSASVSGISASGSSGSSSSSGSSGSGKTSGSGEPSKLSAAEGGR